MCGQIKHIRVFSRILRINDVFNMEVTEDSRPLAMNELPENKKMVANKVIY